MPLDRRRADGPDRAHPHRRRFDLRAAARGAGARPRAPLLHARPARLQRPRVVRRGAAARGAGTSRATTRGSAKPRRIDLADVDVVLLRQDPPFDLAYIDDDAPARAHPPAHAGGQRPAQRARRAGKAVRDGFPRADAADADRPRPRRDRGVPRRARRGGDEAALRLRRRGGVQGRANAIRISARCSTCSRPPSASPG